MDKIVVGFVGGNTNLDRAIKYFNDSEEYDITHAFTMLLNSTCESRGIKENQTHMQEYGYMTQINFVVILLQDL